MKTLLVHVQDDPGLTNRITAAAHLARRLAAHLSCIQVTPYAAYALGEPAIGGFGMTALVEAVEADRKKVREQVEAQLSQLGQPHDWIGCDGDISDWIAEESRLADLVVMSGGPWKAAKGEQLAVAGRVAIGAPAPLLLLPPAATDVDIGGAVLVCWDGSQEAAQALRLGLPLLRHASSVTLLTVDEKSGGAEAPEAVTWLARHGVAAGIVARTANGHGVEAVIRAEIADRHCAWAALGAYGHSRLRETLFGGVTRGLMCDTPVPLLFGH